jgi:ribonuclease P protein component
MQRLRRRTDFRAAAAGLRASGAAFAVQARRRVEDGPARVGFTVSRQVGNAVERNRVRRRLREMVRLTEGQAEGRALRSGHDYVLIGRRAALNAAFGEMRRQLDAALHRIDDRERARGTDNAAQGTGDSAAASLHQAGSPRQRRPHRQPPNA